MCFDSTDSKTSERVEALALFLCKGGRFSGSLPAMDVDGAPSDSAPTAKRGRAHDTPSDLDSALDSLVIKLGATTHDGAPSDSAPTAKRGRAHHTPSDLDSALDSLVIKLGATTHDDKETLVAVLVDVLHVEPEIATFYLEASNWNPSEAVELLMQQTAGGEVVQALADSGVSKRSRPMPVLVNGLPDGWAARVSAAGTIVFEHLATGYEQSTIPPGFQAAASSDERADEPAMAAEAEDETAQELRRHKSATEQAVAQLVCPITRSLPFDPVIAEDGKVYERSAIEEWLKQQGKSPLTNLPMGTKLLPAMHVKNMIRVMVTSGTLTGDHAEAEDETAQELRRHKSATEQAVAQLVCPITRSLPFDPVIAEDGKVYERSAIEEWLKQQGKSPLTNLPMGTKLLPAMHVKNMIRVMVTSGTLTGDKADEWELRRKEEEQALRNAASRGHDQQLRNLLEAGAAVDAADDESRTALMAAAKNGHERVALVLLEAKADPNQALPNGATALFIAAECGHERCALVLLEAKADPNQAKSDGWTALMWAAQKGHEQVALVLLEAKADPNQAKSDGWTALMKAAGKGHEQVALVLLKAKADPNQAMPDGSTALMIAAQDGHEQVALALLKAGAVVSALNNDGWTALILAAQDGHEQVALVLLEAKADPNQANAKGDTALILAAQDGHEQVALALLEAKADPNQARPDGWTALILAAEHGHERVALVLLKAKADPNQAMPDGSTALMIAAQDGHEQVALALLEAKADPNQARPDGSTALMIAAQDGHEQVALALLEAKADPNQARPDGSTALILAAQDGHEQVALALLEAKADPNQARSDGSTALILAAQDGHEQVALALLEAKADPNQARSDGSTALMFAAQDGHKQVALVLLEAGASLKVVSIDNFTMLMAASFGGLTTVLERVLPQSDIDAALVASHATEAGYTALMYAAKAGQQHCVHMLLSAGARKEVQTATGKTAFSLAHDSGHTAICDLLAQ